MGYTAPPMPRHSSDAVAARWIWAKKEAERELEAFLNNQPFKLRLFSQMSETEKHHLLYGPPPSGGSSGKRLAKS